VTRRIHPDVAVIEPDAGKIKIEQVRRLQLTCSSRRSKGVGAFAL
jgi:hypothetical protein